MFAYIKGVLEDKGLNYVVIDVGGVGYKVFVTSKALNDVGELGSIVKVHTHHYVREDNISLYGFLNNDELRMFELLLSVSGIGAKSAIAMLSEISPSSFALAIITNDISKLVGIPGIGNKTAARIVLELKDKLKNDAVGNDALVVPNGYKDAASNTKASETASALQVLGYTKREIDKALEQIDVNKLELEEIIKQALKLLGR